MLLTERPQSDSETSAVTSPDVRLRVHGGARDLETIPLAAGNHAFGSGPKCSVRLRDAGVGPMHGLIVLDNQGARVRRWANGTLLNGRTFDEECLSAGDRLSVGPIDLEIIGPASSLGTWYPISLTPDVSNDEADDEPPAPVTSAVEKSLDDFQESVASLDASDEPTPPAVGRPARRRANRKLRTTLRRQQTAFERLLSQVEGLAERVETAFAERSAAAATITGDAAATPLGISVNWEAEDFEQSPAAKELIAWAEERLELIDRNAELETELAEARQRLSEAAAELVAAQASIDELQARLTDSQRNWEELAEERSLWQQQLAELETQLEELSVETRQLRDELEAREARSNDSRADVTKVIEWPMGRGSADVVMPALLDEPVDRVAASVTVEEEAFDESLPTESSDSAESPWHGGSYDWSSQSAADESDSPSDAPLETENGTHDQKTLVLGDDVAERGSESPWAVEKKSSDDAEKPEGQVRDGLHLLAESMPSESEGGLAAPAVALRRTSNTTTDIEGVVAHLRELALWRQSSENDVHIDESEPVAAEEEAAATDGEVGDSTVAESLPPSVAHELAHDEAALAATELEPESEPQEQIGAPTIAVEAQEPAVAPLVDASNRVKISPATPVTSSFIERYAHIFEQEAPAEKPPTLASAVSLKEEPKPVRAAEPLMSNGPQANDHASAGDGEDSIEHYMARMMQRIRGDAAASGSSSGSQAMASASNNAGANQRTSETSGQTISPAGNASTANTSVEAPAEQTLIRLEDLKSKVPTPEFGTDMNALRALANQSARHAIGVHTARTLRRKATTRFIVSLLAGVTSLYFMLNAPDWESREFGTACVALIASIYWGQMTAVSLLKAVRVGAFDEIETDFKSVDKLDPALPIDMARR